MWAVLRRCAICRRLENITTTTTTAIWCVAVEKWGIATGSWTTFAFTFNQMLSNAIIARTSLPTKPHLRSTSKNMLPRVTNAQLVWNTLAQQWHSDIILKLNTRIKRQANCYPVINAVRRECFGRIRHIVSLHYLEWISVLKPLPRWKATIAWFTLNSRWCVKYVRAASKTERRCDTMSQTNIAQQLNPRSSVTFAAHGKNWAWTSATWGGYSKTSYSIQV